MSVGKQEGNDERLLLYLEIDHLDFLCNNIDTTQANTSPNLSDYF